jgi:hypothetical protein
MKKIQPKKNLNKNKNWLPEAACMSKEFYFLGIIPKPKFRIL